MGVSLVDILEHKDVTKPCNMVWNMLCYAPNSRLNTENECLNVFKRAFFENPELALRCLFYIRDVRAGLGERRFFRICLKWLAIAQQKIAIQIMPEIPNFGRWDDLFVFIGTPVQKEMANLLSSQLVKDLQTEKPSLLAKWMKSANATSKESRETGNKLRVLLGLNQKQYRKMLTTLRSKINLIETQMSEHNWHKIKYEQVPAEAMRKYAWAFYEHDKMRFLNNKNLKIGVRKEYPKINKEDMLKTLQGLRYSRI